MVVSLLHVGLGASAQRHFCQLALQTVDGDTEGGASVESERRKRKGRNDDELSDEDVGVSASGALEGQDDHSDGSGACISCRHAHCMDDVAVSTLDTLFVTILSILYVATTAAWARLILEDANHHARYCSNLTVPVSCKTVFEFVNCYFSSLRFAGLFE